LKEIFLTLTLGRRHWKLGYSSPISLRSSFWSSTSCAHMMHLWT
jgi:hypothetical protein